MKIMICGGYDDEPENFKDRSIMEAFTKALAKELILQGHQLRSGNQTELDKDVIDAACEAAEEREIDDDEVVISYISPKSQEATNRGRIRNSASSNWESINGRKPQVPEPIKAAEVLVLVGGYEGTYTAANWARLSNTPMLPVATFGLAAADILEDELNSPLEANVNRLTEDELEKLKRAVANLRGEKQQECIKQYVAEIISLAEKAAHSREVFIMMSFEENNRLTDFKDAVKSVCKASGFKADRIDEIPTGNSYDIVEKIHREIEACGFVVADLTGERPNVYYEIGYARGLGKNVILTIAKGEDVHFDISGQKRITWDGHVDLRDKLRPELKHLSKSFGVLGNGEQDEE